MFSEYELVDGLLLRVLRAGAIMFARCRMIGFRVYEMMIMDFYD